jgi:sugar phosphate isomerase/epimerase
MNLPGQRIEEYWDRSVQVARAMGEVAAEYDSVIGCENCYPVVRFADVTDQFLGEVDHPNVGMTLDTGHFWSAVIEDELGHGKAWPLWKTPEGVDELNNMLYDMARTVAGRIVNIHMHNLRPSDWKDHQPVGEGIMEYDTFFEILNETGYDQTLMVEIRNPDGNWAAFESSARYLQTFMPGTGST